MPVPDLEERFLQPPGWRSHHFESHGKRITYGCVFPADSVPDAVVVCLPGLSEFTEKYYEVARTCLDMNLAFWVLDWPGQGRADRDLSNRQKRHADDFGIDVERLNDFIMGYIKHSSVHTDKGRIPLVMLGHSMGANIGLRYLSRYPDLFSCATFSAPMFGIKALNSIPFSGILLKIFNWLKPESYVSGGSDWHMDMRGKDDHGVFSHDDAREKIHSTWSNADPELAVGSPTFGWLYHAENSCRFIKRKSFLSTVKTPCLITMAGKETIVDNKDTKRAVAHLENAELLEFEDSGHEILMESDTIRDQFFAEFYKLIEKTVLKRPESLKPF